MAEKEDYAVLALKAFSPVTRDMAVVGQRLSHQIHALNDPPRLFVFVELRKQEAF